MSQQGFLRRNSFRTHGMAGTIDFRLDRFSDPLDAPFGHPVMIEVDDGMAAGPYRLPFQCVRTAKGWLNAKSQHPLAANLTVTGWKYGLSHGRLG